jgi:CBS-domain-containing membrane protein
LLYSVKNGATRGDIKTEDRTFILGMAIAGASAIELALILMGDGKEYCVPVVGAILLIAGILTPADIISNVLGGIGGMLGKKKE